MPLTGVYRVICDWCGTKTEYIVEMPFTNEKVPWTRIGTPDDPTPKMDYLCQGCLDALLGFKTVRCHKKP
jgi:hypothetical protein